MALNCLRIFRPSQLWNFTENSCIIIGSTLSRPYATQPSKDYDKFRQVVEKWKTTIKRDEMSTAMKVYLQRAKENDEFMKHQEMSYQIGKRHLANIMGEDPETFTQEKIDNAIRYLFPSGIYDYRAHPMMKNPQDLFPARKSAEFDKAGRPFHFLYYTGKANYFKLLFDIRSYADILTQHNNSMRIKKLPLDPESCVSMTGFTWKTQEEFETMIIEKILPTEYKIFTQSLDALLATPYSNRYKDFIEQYRKPMGNVKISLDVPLPQYDENGKAFVTTYECLKKKARGHVTIRSPGTGLISINTKDITYFQDKQSREQLMFPLIFTNMTKSVDIECHVEGGGFAGQSAAMRWGISMSLRSFVDQNMVEQMRLAGLLTRDRRRQERMKPGQAGARKKFTWKKR